MSWNVPLFLSLTGHESVFQIAFRAGGNAVQAADAVRVAHKIGVGHVDVHGADSGALAALSALLCVALDAEDAQHTEQALAGASGAEVIAERAVDKQGEQQEEDDDATGCREQMPMPEHGKVLRPLQQVYGDAYGQQQVDDIAAQLQVALDALWHTQTRQLEQSPQPGHPVLRCSQLAYPPAEEYTCHQDAGQQPLAHFFRIRREAVDEPQHENELDKSSE